MSGSSFDIAVLVGVAVGLLGLCAASAGKHEMFFVTVGVGCVAGIVAGLAVLAAYGAAS